MSDDDYYLEAGKALHKFLDCVCEKRARNIQQIRDVEKPSSIEDCHILIDALTHYAFTATMEKSYGKLND